MATELLGFLFSHSPLFYWYGAGCVVVGILIHFYKKVLKERTTFRKYFLANKRTSLQGILGAAFAYLLLLIQHPYPDVVTLIGAGYIMDSILNSET
tara:strand:- start:598 stop:885 length:288 start_codon:yes stop_codon:yes gene_type:complete